MKKKRLLRQVLLSCLLLTTLIFSSWAVSASGTEHTDHARAVAVHTERELLQMADGGKYYLDADIVLSSTVEISGEVELCLNGKVLKYGGEERGSIFRIKKEGNLRILDCSHAQRGYREDGDGLWRLTDGAPDASGGTLVGGVLIGGTGAKRETEDGDSYFCGGFAYIDGGSLSVWGGNIIGNTADYGGAVYVTEHGSLTLHGGKLCGNRADTRGGAVFVNSGTMNLLDGTVSSNRALKNGGGIGISSEGVFQMHGGFVTKNSAGAWSGGVENFGVFELHGGTVSQNSAREDAGGIYNGGAFAMHGGSIRENAAKYGGGVCNDGNMTLNDGNVLSNLAQESGGGIYNGGKLIVNGGNIASNTAVTSGGGIENDGTLTMYGGRIGGAEAGSANSAYLGGGVCVYSGTFTMHGGSIEKNTGVDGGGVENEATFVLLGGTVSYNYAATQGGGITNRGHLSLGGSAQVVSNASGAGSGEYKSGGIYWIANGDSSLSVSGSPRVSGNTTNGADANLVIFGEGAVLVESISSQAVIGLCLLNEGREESRGVAVRFENAGAEDSRKSLSCFSSDSDRFRLKMKGDTVVLVRKRGEAVVVISAVLAVFAVSAAVALCRTRGKKRKSR